MCLRDRCALAASNQHIWNRKDAPMIFGAFFQHFWFISYWFFCGFSRFSGQFDVFWGFSKIISRIILVNLMFFEGFYRILTILRIPIWNWMKYDSSKIGPMKRLHKKNCWKNDEESLKKKWLPVPENGFQSFLKWPQVPKNLQIKKNSTIKRQIMANYQIDLWNDYEFHHKSKESKRIPSQILQKSFKKPILGTKESWKST